jgi:hypothetical protein
VYVHVPLVAHVLILVHGLLPGACAHALMLPGGRAPYPGRMLLCTAGRCSVLTPLPCCLVLGGALWQDLPPPPPEDLWEPAEIDRVDRLEDQQAVAVAGGPNVSCCITAEVGANRRSVTHVRSLLGAVLTASA